jgi:hypothetical protein
MHKRFRNRDLIQTHKTVKTQQKKTNQIQIQTQLKFNPNKNKTQPKRPPPQQHSTHVQSICFVCVCGCWSASEKSRTRPARAHIQIKTRQRGVNFECANFPQPHTTLNANNGSSSPFPQSGQVAFWSWLKEKKGGEKCYGFV